MIATHRLLATSLNLILLGGVLSSKPTLEAVEEFHDLLASSGSLFDGTLTTSFQMEVTPEDAQCYNGTFFVLDYNLPGGLVSAFSARETLYCFLTGECDFAGSEFEQAAADNCVDSNGRLVTSDLYVCRTEFGAQGVGDNENIKLANIPLCVDPNCPADTTYQKILKTSYALGLGGDASFEGTFTGKCAPTEIDWKLESAPFEQIVAKVGDEITFNYDSADNVYIHPDGGCNEGGAIFIGSSGPTSYTFMESDSGKTIVFASNVGSRCEEGQILSVVVQGEDPGPKVIEIDWSIPAEPYANQTARVGDTVKFNYSPSHNVYKHPEGTCDEKHSLLVGDATGPGFYLFIEEDRGTTVTFACDIGSHCEVGQIIHFEVEGELIREGQTETPGTTPAIPTMAPSVAPTLLPADDFAAGIANGEYDVILDVRSEAEWNSGHIEGATLAISLGSFGNMGHMGAAPSDLAGCEQCTIAVYCRTGSRASGAIQVLLNNGFQGKLYNGQGTSQWTSAGYPLVTGDSVVAPCTLAGPGNCGSKGNIPDRKEPNPDKKNGFKLERTRAGTDFEQLGVRGGGRRKLTNAVPQEME